MIPYCERFSKLSLKALLLFLLFLIPMTSQAAALSLPDTPLFLGSNVAPNVFFELDDSGSMDWEIMTPAYWHPCAYDPEISGGFSSSNCGYEITTGVARTYANSGYRNIVYLYNTSDNDYGDSCSSGSYNSTQTCGTIDDEWRTHTSSLNRNFYDPDLSYEAWQGPCLSDDTTCADATFTAARSNPRQGMPGYGVTRSLEDFQYHVWVDDKGYSGSRPQRGTNVNATSNANTEVDLWDSYLKVIIGSNSASIYTVTFNPNTSGMNRTETLVATLSDSSACYDALGSNTHLRNVFNGTGSYTSVGASTCRTLSATQTNIANWYSYERRRSFAAKAAISAVVTDSPNYRYGLSVINYYSTLFHDFPISDEVSLSAHNLELKKELYDYEWRTVGTPLRRGLDRTGTYYQGSLYGVENTNPILHACQQNFTILLTDGFWNGGSPSSVVGNSDGDSHNSTLADVAHHYYSTDLSTLEDIVPTNTFDTATHQHMVTYTVALGVTGDLSDTDEDGWPNPALTESSDWGNPFASNTAKVDDLWHAAYNSRGTFVAAQSSSELSSSLSAALANIADRVSSATSVAQNSTTLQTNSQVYQAKFDSSDWHGELLAFSINSDGQLSQSPLWNANCRLTGGDCATPTGTHEAIAPEERVIITRDWSSNAGMAFQFPSDYSTLISGGTAPTNLSNLMANAPYSVTTTTASEIADNQNYGDKLVAYLRGDRNNEDEVNNVSPVFRDRNHILGDIVHSDPLYVGKPIRLYADNFESQPYSTFRSTYEAREAIVYTGANDGMVHGFRASDGVEVLAYVPGMRENYSALSRLSQTTYSHEYTVDGSPASGDVFINGQWRTILTGGLRRGGQGIYALDVTDPSTFTEGNADDIFLFEFTDEDDADLGYTFSRLSIAKVHASSSSTKWAIIFGNGYNNAEADGYPSTSGAAALYIVFIEDAADGTISSSDFIKLTVSGGDTTTPNGLATPYPVDTDGDFITDYIYAGDLLGNLWRFDVTDTDPTNWSANTQLLFAAGSTQPITASPIVGAHPNGVEEGVLVYFGTGKYLEQTDNSADFQSDQSFYAIWDKLGTDTVESTDLLQQTILDEEQQGFDTDGNGTIDKTVNARRTSANSIDWDTHLGWELSLVLDGDNRGERQITRPLLRNGAIIFTTLVPATSSCSFGGDSWIMELDANSGSALPQSPFDFNENDQFDDGDKVQFNYGNSSELAAASGYQSEVGITATPAVFVSPDKLSEVKVISGSAGLGSFTEGPVNTSVGRQTWRQIK